MSSSAWPFEDAETWRRYDGFVRRVAASLLADPHAVDDVVQQTWTAALRGGPRSGRAWPTWLARVVGRAAHRRRRTEERRLRREQVAARPEAVASVEDLRASEEVRRQVVDAVFALPQVYRDALMLRFFDDLAPRDVAVRLGVPVETARTRIRRGLAQLRGDLERARGSDWRGALALLPLVGIPSVAKTGTVMLMANKIKMAAVAAVLSVATYMCWPGDPASLPVSDQAKPVAQLQTRIEPIVTAAPGTNAPVDPTRIATSTAATGTLIVTVLHAGGSRAADIAVEVTFHAPMPELLTLQAMTDARGEARFVDLAPGQAYINACGRFDARHSTEVYARATARVTLTVRPAGRLLGVVVDEIGRGVPHAGLYVEWGWPLFAQKVGEADAEGRFSLLDIGGFIGARAQGYAPSALRLVQLSEGAERTVRFELQQQAAVLEGRVVTAAGSPVPAAVVFVGEKNLVGFMLPDGGAGKAASPVRTVTDADGRFRADDLDTHKTTLLVCGEDLAPTTQAVETVRGRTTEVVVVVQKAAAVVGRLLTPDGAPAQMTSVRLLDPEDRFRRFTSANADGTFRLGHLPVGEVVLQAMAHGFASTSATFTLSPGQEQRWDVRFDAGRTLRGRVLDDLDEPVAAHVTARVRVGTWEGRVRTDAAGRFTLSNLASDRIDEIELANGFGQTPFFVERDLAVTDAEVVLRVPAQAEGRVVARGRVIDTQGMPIATAGVCMFRVGIAGSFDNVDAATGRFRTKPQSPGEFVLQCRADGFAWRTFGPKIFAGSAVWDVGDVVMPRGERLTALVSLPAGEAWPPSVEGPPGQLVLPFTGELRDAEGVLIAAPQMREAGELEFQLIAAGAYRLRVSGSGLASAVVEVLARQGVDTRVDVPLVRGVQCTFVMPRALPPRSSAEVRVLGPDGHLVTSWPLPRSLEGAAPAVQTLPPGRYRAELIWREKAIATASFVAEGSAVEVTLSSK